MAEAESDGESCEAGLTQSTAFTVHGGVPLRPWWTA